MYRADQGHLGWVEHEVVDPARPRVDPPVLDPVYDGLERHAEVDHNINRGFCLQSLCLRLGFGKAIQQPSFGSKLLQL